jgi:hypothetical protein
VAITVSEPPSAILRAAGSGRRDVLERVDEHDGVAAAGRDAAALLDRLLHDLRLRVGRGGEAHAAALPQLLGPDAREHHRDIDALERAERLGEAAQRLGLAGARRAGDHHTRALAERRQPLDRLHGRVLGPELEALARERHRQVLEAGALGDLVGRAAVDRVDADQRREAL